MRNELLRAYAFPQTSSRRVLKSICLRLLKHLCISSSYFSDDLLAELLSDILGLHCIVKDVVEHLGIVVAYVLQGSLAEKLAEL